MLLNNSSPILYDMFLQKCNVMNENSSVVTIKQTLEHLVMGYGFNSGIGRGRVVTVGDLKRGVPGSVLSRGTTVIVIVPMGKANFLA